MSRRDRYIKPEWREEIPTLPGHYWVKTSLRAAFVIELTQADHERDRQGPRRFLAYAGPLPEPSAWANDQIDDENRKYLRSIARNLEGPHRVNKLGVNGSRCPTPGEVEYLAEQALVLMDLEDGVHECPARGGKMLVHLIIGLIGGAAIAAWNIGGG